MNRFSIFVGLLATLPVPLARADVFHLVGGGQVEGELLNPKEEPRTSYVIQIDGGKVAFAKARVARVEVKSEAEQNYEKFLLDMPPTAEGNWKMAEFCRENRLGAQRDFHLQRVIDLDPDHEKARYGLGYSRVEGRWIKTDEFNRSRGLVPYKGRWVTPQEIVIEKHREASEQAQSEWRVKVKRWRSWLGKKRSAEGIREIRAVSDWQAADAVVRMLDDERDPRMKVEWIDVLGNIKSPIATTALVRYALEDDDPRLRERCLTKLETWGTRPAVEVFLRALDDKDNVRINRAGIALGRMQDPDAIMPLIDHLVTTHTAVVGGNTGGGGLGQIGATFGSGGTGLNTGSKTQVIKAEVYNQGVRDALIALTGQNHNLPDDWRNWYEREHTPSGVSLRRRDD